MNHVKSKVIITGAASGIGKAVAEKCYDEGIEVFACDCDEAALKNLQSLLPGIHSYVIDVSDHTAATSFFKEIHKHSIQWLVNNAGVYPGRNLLNYTPEQVHQLISNNCMGAVYFTQFFAKNIIEKKSKGSIVNISSVSGQHGSSDAIYGLTKAALLGFTKSCAINFAPFIRVNAVAPGLTETGILQNISPPRYREIRSREILPENILPSDVAESVYFLLSDKARNITGMTLDINNGQYLR